MKVKQVKLLDGMPDPKSFDFDALDSYIRVRVNSNMLKILKDNDVHISKVVRAGLSNVANQLIDLKAKIYQPDFYVIEIANGNDEEIDFKN